MIISLNKDKLYSIFNVDSFDQLESSFEGMAPSMVEYYLSSLGSNDEIYINRSKIQNIINLDGYILYFDYDDNVYLEISINNNDEYSTGSLW